MPKEIIITIHDNGDMEVEGTGLKPGEQIKDVAEFVVNVLGNVTETGHKHTHTELESDREIQR